MTLPGIALFLLLAQNTGPQQPVVPASIEGVVVNSDNGTPVSRAVVTLTEIRAAQTNTLQFQQLQALGLPDSTISTLQARAPGAPQTTTPTMTTASDGRFLFENLKPGTYSLRAALGGYAPTEYGQRTPSGRGINITVNAGQKLQNASLSMTPEGTITGRVTDANGDPLSRALVEALKVTYQENGRSLVTVEAVPTDDRGEYRLFWLPPGQYYIRATPMDEGRLRTLPVVLPSANNSNSSTRDLSAYIAINGIRDFSVVPSIGVLSGVKVTSRALSNGEIIEEAAVPMYYPAAADISTATPVEIRAGRITGGIEIRTATTRVYRIQGTVINGITGQAVNSGTINLLQRNGSTISPAIQVPQTPNSTSFEIAGVVPGSYYLIGDGIDSTGRRMTGITLVDVRASNIPNVIISVTPGVAISGRIVNPSVPNLAARPQSYVVRLIPQTPGLPSNTTPALPDGTFTLNGILPGDYRVLVSTPPGIVAKSILYEGKDAQYEGLHIGSASSGTMEIVVTSGAGRLEGNVVSEKQQRLSNVTVVLIPAFALRQQTNLYQSVQTNGEGHFTIENITPGSYKLLAWDNVEDRAWFDAEFMRSFESRGREISISEGARESIELTVIPR